MRLRLLTTLCALFFGLVLVMPSAFANSYTYTTTGTFASSSGPTITLTDSISSVPDATLNFNNIGSQVTVPGGVTISLGSFSFSVLNPNSNYTPFSDQFALTVTFYAPPATNTSALPFFFAPLDGNVFGGAGGGTITFNPTSQQFTTADGSTFLLNLNMNPIQVNSTNSTATIYATIVEMPEGSSVPMLGVSGIVLLGAGAMKMRMAIG